MINNTSKTIIIAEAGVNHNGSIGIAKKLIDIASNAQVDYIKFQTFKADKVVTKLAEKADYQKKSSDKTENQLELLKKLELSESDHKELLKYCNQKSIKFLSTPFDTDSIELLVRLGVKVGKIPSGEVTNLPFLRKMGSSFEEIIMSTGMANIKEIKQALKALTDMGILKENIVILHCNTEYPTPYEDVNLKAMLDIKKKTGINVGYSDHTLGIEVPIAAVALGAKVIEKHFTLDKSLEGPDHLSSVSPDELVQMVISIRNIEKAIQGDGIKTASKSELKNKILVRRSIVASRKICKGEVFSDFNLTTKRPGKGISPMKWDTIIGKIAKKDYEKDEMI